MRIICTFAAKIKESLKKRHRFFPTHRLMEAFLNMIYCISKQMEVAGSHQLSLSYESKCSRLHGHNWVIIVFLASTQLNADGMVVDFKRIKEAVHGYLDHGNFNDLLPFNPTAENIAEWVVRQFPECYKVIVKESDGNVAQAYDDHFPIEPEYLL